MVTFFLSLPLSSISAGCASPMPAGASATSPSAPDAPRWTPARGRPAGIALEDKRDPFTGAVLTTLKGPELALPPGYAFHDHKGVRRTEIRASWWNTAATTWRDIAASVPDPSELPEGDVSPGARIDPGQCPVIFGHYKRGGQVLPEGPRLLCLDYPETPVAYRWDGETQLDPARIVPARG